jgi:hypothetical protein
MLSIASHFFQSNAEKDNVECRPKIRRKTNRKLCTKFGKNWRFNAIMIKLFLYLVNKKQGVHRKEFYYFWK